MEKKTHTTHAEQTHASKTYPGVAVNQGNDNKNTEKLEKERTCIINNNRNNEQR